MRCILSGMNNEPVARSFVEMVLKLFVRIVAKFHMQRISRNNFVVRRFLI